MILKMNNLIFRIKFLKKSLSDRQQIQASLAKLSQTKPVSYHPKNLNFRTKLIFSSPSLTQSIEIYTLSCLLRLIGRFSRKKRWEQVRGLIKKSNFWEFVNQVQSWIANNSVFVGIAEEKLKYFVHDNEHFVLSNFDFIYQRIKGLLENYWINPKKLKQVFTKPVNKRQKTITYEAKTSGDSQTQIETFSIFISEKNGKIFEKKIYWMTQLKYQAMNYQIEAIDETSYMKQVFLKRPSSHHRVQIERKRQRMKDKFLHGFNCR